MEAGGKTFGFLPDPDHGRGEEGQGPDGIFRADARRPDLFRHQVRRAENGGDGRPQILSLSVNIFIERGRFIWKTIRKRL